MYFSEAFGIEYSENYEWFDPILELDTLLFVDPFLIFEDDEEEWRLAHNQITSYFHDAFELLAGSGLKKTHQYYRRTLALMEFPEPKEFRLGYASGSADGSGSGPILARLIVEAMGEAIARGLDDIQHFEELGILVEGINRDRISDVTCNLLKPKLISFTQRIAEEFQIPTRLVEVPHSKFDSLRQRWLSATHSLPIAPANGKPIILVPKRFLRELPTINAGDWYDHIDATLRDDLNFTISRNVRKADIIAAARKHPEAVRQWVQQQEETGSEPYDVDVDPRLYVRWQRVARDAVLAQPFTTSIRIESPEGLLEFVRTIVGRVRHWAEKQGGWRVFWTDAPHLVELRDGEKVYRGGQAVLETNMQLLLMGMVDAYCESAGVLVDREVETGRGPVDFAFTGDHRIRVVLEMKKLTHGRFWEGLRVQTPQYMEGLRVKHAIFLAIRDSETPAMRLRWRSLKEEAELASEASGMTIEVERIDALPKESASRASE
ncbi:hypothetical protein ACFO1B_44835 [Dactylosporangium siamense]|uniref:Uncharacterized protein n=1 Tax=Dactylosporangium siamense TaxID=685454 RepID=A0A919PZ90_9ACTN|nr:hypothetical protein [Dactylosporangium siamense]GIG51288.1 hypothetical protein Dsi01nite_093290 [Dactylosporangium siamense]